MANLAWGKPVIKIGKLGSNDAPPTEWIAIPTPVTGSTQLTTTKGATREAPLEGGGFEDKGYNKNTYTLEFELYASKGRQKPVDDVDGIIDGFYQIMVQPEDPAVEGIIIKKAALTVEDTYSAEIGAKWKYTADVLIPATGNQIQYEVISFPVVNVSGVTLNKTTLSMQVGKYEALVAIVAPENATNKAVTWETSDAAKATVDKNGVIKAIAAGTATITVKTVDGNKTATCTVTITA